MIQDNYVVVIGGANVDIGGTPRKPLVAADSNPGDISISCGGVGRNIAENISRLGIPVKMITATGDDYGGRFIKSQCESAGMDMSLSLILPEEKSSVYLYINDYEGDMSMAVSHMDIVSKITPDYIDSVSDIINCAKAVVVDGNVSEECFRHLIKICRVPLYSDPVSTAHAGKLKGNLAGLYTIKPNRLEAEFLTEMTISSDADYKAAAREIIEQGVERVFLSMGEKGMLAADKNDCFIIERVPANVVSTTGAGDSATAAIVWADIMFDDLKEITGKDNKLITSAIAANTAAAMTIEVASSNDPSLSQDRIIEKIKSAKY